jgi:hypothetical protein
MTFNKEIPPILGPGVQNPDNYSPVFPDHDFVDLYQTRVAQGHFWRRIKATHVPCGDNAFALEVTYKRGISQTLLAEVASALELSVPPLKNTLSSKISASNTLSDEETVKYTRTLKPTPGYAITFAEWHKIVHSVLRRQKYFLWFKTRMSEQEIDIGTEETYPDQLEYLDPACSLANIKENLENGYSEIYTLDLGFVRFAVQGKKTGAGKISLAGITGQFAPGKPSESKELFGYLRSIDRLPGDADVTLSQSLGTVSKFYGWSKPRKIRGSSSPIPWLVALGVGSFLAYLLRSAKQRQQIVEKQYGQGSGAQEAFPIEAMEEGVPRNTPLGKSIQTGQNLR